MNTSSDSTDDLEETPEENPGEGRWPGLADDFVLVNKSDDAEKPPNKFEWRPEDVVVLEPRDPGYDGDDDGDE